MPIQLWRQRSWFRPRWEEEEPPIINCNSFWRKNRNLCFCIGDDDDDKENDLQSTSGRRFLAAPRGSRCQLCRKLQPLRPQITTRLQKKHYAAKFCQKIRCWPKMNPVNTKWKCRFTILCFKLLRALNTVHRSAHYTWFNRFLLLTSLATVKSTLICMGCL